METYKLIELALTKAADHYGVNWKDLFRVRESKEHLSARIVAMYALSGVLSYEWVCSIFEINERTYWKNLQLLRANDDEMVYANTLRKEVVQMQLALTKEYKQAA